MAGADLAMIRMATHITTMTSTQMEIGGTTEEVVEVEEVEGAEVGNTIRMAVNITDQSKCSTQYS